MNSRALNGNHSSTMIDSTGIRDFSKGLEKQSSHRVAKLSDLIKYDIFFSEHDQGWVSQLAHMLLDSASARRAIPPAALLLAM